MPRLPKYRATKNKKASLESTKTILGYPEFVFVAGKYSLNAGKLVSLIPYKKTGKISGRTYTDVRKTMVKFSRK